MELSAAVAIAAVLVAPGVLREIGGPAPAAARPCFSDHALARAVAATGDSTLVEEGPSRSVAVSAADTHRSWEALARTARAGRIVVVTLADATRVEGRLLAVNRDSLTVQRSGGTSTFKAADVVRVRDAGVRRRHVLHGMLLGMAAGAVAMVAVDQRSSHPSSVAEAAGLGALVIGLPAGAAAGALLPIGSPLYEAPGAVHETP
jgi:hypothetical protein